MLLKWPPRMQSPSPTRAPFPSARPCLRKVSPRRMPVGSALHRASRRGTPRRVARTSPDPMGPPPRPLRAHSYLQKSGARGEDAHEPVSSLVKQTAALDSVGIPSDTDLFPLWVRGGIPRDRPTPGLRPRRGPSLLCTITTTFSFILPRGSSFSEVLRLSSSHYRSARPLGGLRDHPRSIDRGFPPARPHPNVLPFGASRRWTRAGVDSRDS
jgi:hypothetical protein